MPDQVPSLHDALAAALPKAINCNVRYVYTPPKLCNALFAPLPGHDPEKTWLISHFLAASASDIQDTVRSDVPNNDVLFLGIEVLVYVTKHLKTIFVSKADSTGYHNKDKPSPVRAIITTLLQWLVNQQFQKHPERQVVISLFARAQSQYLFPGSAKNGMKHVLDDRQLIKWWARVLDPILTQESEGRCRKNDGSDAGAWVTVPGYEGSELRQFFPPASRSTHLWKPGNPLVSLGKARGLPESAPPRTLLPRFPDDPKARFMEDLDDEVGISGDPSKASPSKQKHGVWETIKNLDRFWEAMEFRQECSSGRMVGFLWLVITPKRSRDTANVVDTTSQDSTVTALPDAPSSDPIQPPSEGLPAPDHRPKKRRRKPLTGPIVPRQPRLKGSSSALSATNSDLNGMLNNVQGDGLMLTKEGYDQALQTLLNLEFGTEEAAARSTTKWVDEVRSICGLSRDWAVTVVGEAEPTTAAAAPTSANGQVNDLGGMVRKKRKATDSVAPNNGHFVETRLETAKEPTVNVLGAGLVRKKPKQPTPAS